MGRQAKLSWKISQIPTCYVDTLETMIQLLVSI